MMIIAEPDKTQEMYEQNLQLLTPWLQKAMRSVDDEEMHKRIEVTYNDEGYPLCRYRREGKCFQITSVQPVQEAVQWYGNIAEQGTGAIFLFGAGFGYSLFEIFEHKPPHTLVVLFEQDLYLFKAMLYYFDFAPLINTHKIAILVGDSEFFANAFEDLFFSIFFVNCTFPTLAFSYSAIRNFKKEYIDVYRYVFSQLSLMVFYIGNDHQDNLIGFCNLISNVGEVIKNPSIRCLENKYQDVPAFIIANGPSLDKNIDQIKEIAGRGLVICVESAILPLLKHGIKPDVLAVIERTKNTYLYHFKDIDYPKDIALLGLALADKHVFPSFPGEKIPIFRDREVQNVWINSFIGDGSALDAGANVSHLAAELAAYMGANPIVFVGQDYAYGPGGNTHSAESVYNQKSGRHMKEAIQSRPVVYVEGNDGSQLESNTLWVDFRLGLERKIAVHPDKVFINATQGGAKIKGTRCDTLQNVIRQYCKAPLQSRVNEVIAQNRQKIRVSEKAEQLKALIADVENAAKQFRSLAEETLRGKIECQNMLRLCRPETFYGHRAALETSYLNHLDIFNRILLNNLFRTFSQQAVFADYYFINRLGAMNTQEKVSEVFRIQHELFGHLNIIGQSVSVHLENAAAELKELQIGGMYGKH